MFFSQSVTKAAPNTRAQKHETVAGTLLPCRLQPLPWPLPQMSNLTAWTAPDASAEQLMHSQQHAEAVQRPAAVGGNGACTWHVHLSHAIPGWSSSCHKPCFLQIVYWHCKIGTAKLLHLITNFTCYNSDSNCIGVLHHALCCATSVRPAATPQAHSFCSNPLRTRPLEPGLVPRMTPGRVSPSSPSTQPMPTPSHPTTPLAAQLP